MARTMMVESKPPRKFWAEAVNTSCYIVNRAMARLSHKMTPYEMFKGKKSSLAHFKVFGANFFIHNNDKKDLDKFEAKSEPGIFLGYASNSRAYRIFNVQSQVVDESPHVSFDEQDEEINISDFDRKDELNGDFIDPKEELGQSNDELQQNVETNQAKTKGDRTCPPSKTLSNLIFLKDHPLDNILGNLQDPPRTRSY